MTEKIIKTNHGPSPLTAEELTELFYNAPSEELSAMGKNVCTEVHGKDVLLRGLLEYTNYCVSNCLYCGIRRDNPNVHRYRIEEAMLLEAVQAGFDRGLRSFVIQGGEDPSYPIERVCGLIEAIKIQTRGEAAVTLSCGMRSREEYRAMAQAGASRYLLRFETSDPELHAYLRDGKTLKDRLQALEDIRAAGFQTGSGFMLGLPGETEKTRLENILLCQKLELDMVGIGPFIPHPETPLKNVEQQPIEDSIRGVALLRLALPESHIPATTAAGTLQPDGREKMIDAGANVLMPNITQTDFKKDYLLYPGKICLDESGIQCIGCLSSRLAPLDRVLSFDKGDAPRIARMRK
ncbi:MAG: [FeFe] hydrogenase H-cluster radical SAM maturase HydE [Spirochaetaceae bacterium 4572_59]|nr:MAG: [FeFe] hydrogenase H-cluster radical SAM maturase HydE [Spirochaetaceae bacterium 4572_59]